MRVLFEKALCNSFLTR